MTHGAPRIAVIDIGKTNAKVAVIDPARLTEISLRTKPNIVRRDGPYPHYDIDGLWAFILDALAGLNREGGIDAITVTAHGATCALLDSEGGLALPVLDYEHDGPEDFAAEYGALRSLFAETGSPRLPLGLNLAAQIFWQERRFPDAFRNVSAIVMYPQYWGFRLTGTAAGEVTSLGSHTDLWCPARRDYASLVDRLGWRRLFAPLRAANDRLGTIRPDIAAATGLRADTPVYCGIHDSNASLLPHLLSRRPPFSVVSTGTWVVAMTVGGTGARLDPERDTLINVNALGEPVPSARFMGGREFAILTDALDAGCTDEDVAAVLGKRTFLLPSVQTGCGPFPRRKAEWVCDGALPPGERRAAASFYLAMMTASCLQLIGADGPTITDGPLAGNALFTQMLAAATGRPVIAETACIGPCAGAALLPPRIGMPRPAEDAAVDSPGPFWAEYARAWQDALRRAPV
ncbi:MULTISPECIES: FGGY-family carbohydrate kinase [Rhodomicrobium]|uniref:FGGY-family carbohydrate kinase n=1 Tax=Rhodomicrobium TaxID=1068 RepID=UPI000B4BB432|nr:MULTISPECIES: FGGY-family carbohydrate kinase [Rhodomicrobium]